MGFASVDLPRDEITNRLILAVDAYLKDLVDAGKVSFECYRVARRLDEYPGFAVNLGERGMTKVEGRFARQMTGVEATTWWHLPGAAPTVQVVFGDIDIKELRTILDYVFRGIG